jgi:predicted outer membrane protein
MTSLIRSLCLAALLAAGSAWAQQQPVDNPDNPHSTKAKDKSSSGVPSSTTNAQVDQAEKPNPHHPDNPNAKPQGTASTQGIDAAQRGNPNDPAYKDRDKMSDPSMASDMDRDAMMKNATPQQQLQKLHMANLHEIEMGKMAEQNGSERVRTYAQTLQRDHQAADKQVMDLAKRKNFTLSDTPKDPQKQQHMQMAKEQFSNLKGAQFDRAFTNRMAMEHHKVISLAQAWKQDCKDRDVCSLIDSQLPTLQQHQNMAEQLRGPAAQGRAPENR